MHIRPTEEKEKESLGQFMNESRKHCFRQTNLKGKEPLDAEFSNQKEDTSMCLDRRVAALTLQ